MATRKPNEFSLRSTLDGTEELYTQTNGVSEKFLLSDICDFCTGDTIVEGGDGIIVITSGSTTTVTTKIEPSGGLGIGVSGGVEVVATGITDIMINWGTGATQVNAKDIPICDIGGNFSGTSVEGALIELYSLPEIQDFGDVLAINNETDGSDIIMSTGDIIAPLLGDGGLDFRSGGVDNNTVLTTDFGGTKGYLVQSPIATQFGFNAISGLYLECTSTELFMRSVASTPYMAWGSGNGGLRDISLFGSTFPFVIVTNASDRDHHTNDVDAVFINTGLSGGSDSTYKAGVKRSVIIGGEGLVAKTDNTTVMQQISLQKSGNGFDTIIESSIATADRTQTAQDKSGTLALLSDKTDKEYTETVDLSGGTPTTITHSLGTTNIIVQIWADDGTVPDVDITKTGVNSIDVESTIGLTDVEVLVYAFG